LTAHRPSARTAPFTVRLDPTDSTPQVLSEVKTESEIAALDNIARIAPQLLAQVVKSTGVEIPRDAHIVA